MIPAFLKIIASVVCLMMLGLWLAYYIREKLESPSITLFDDGYILINPEREAIAFKCPQKANEFAERAAAEAVYFEIYGVYKGKIIHCGSTANSLIA
jgi:hypothetical protein